MLSIRQGMRTMYNYACFDIECLCKELGGEGHPRDEIRRRLDGRAAELLSEAAAAVRAEALAGAPSEEVVAQVDGFLARTTSLCCVLLAPMIEQWIEALGPPPPEGAD